METLNEDFVISYQFESSTIFHCYRYNSLYLFVIFINWVIYCSIDFELFLVTLSTFRLWILFHNGKLRVSNEYFWYRVPFPIKKKYEKLSIL